MAQENYAVKIEWSEDGIWGPGGTDGYDVEASLEKLETNLRAAIAEEYPDAEIEIHLTNINDRVTVFGDDPATEDEMKREVAEIGSTVWQEWDWAVEVE
jgi:hypothetical protein